VRSSGVADQAPSISNIARQTKQFTASAMETKACFACWSYHASDARVAGPAIALQRLYIRCALNMRRIMLLAPSLSLRELFLFKPISSKATGRKRSSITEYLSSQAMAAQGGMLAMVIRPSRCLRTIQQLTSNRQMVRDLHTLQRCGHQAGRQSRKSIFQFSLSSWCSFSSARQCT
jgi:hypothetical protein